MSMATSGALLSDSARPAPASPRAAVVQSPVSEAVGRSAAVVTVKPAGLSIVVGILLAPVLSGAPRTTQLARLAREEDPSNHGLLARTFYSLGSFPTGACRRRR